MKTSFFDGMVGIPLRKGIREGKGGEGGGMEEERMEERGGKGGRKAQRLTTYNSAISLKLHSGMFSIVLVKYV